MKREMSCPHSSKISNCTECMAVLNGMSHTPSTEERDADKDAINEICDVYSMDEALAIFDKRVAHYVAATAKASEAALVDKLRPLLVDEPNMYDTFEWTPQKMGRNQLRAELRQALNLDQEGEDE